MPDLAHLWGNDLAWSPTGDLSTADVPAVTQQRVLRRLLTSPGEYIWDMTYGAGLSAFVGQAGVDGAVAAVIRGQLSKEAGIAPTPAAAIDLTADPSGSLYVHVRYADAATGTTQTVAAPI